jgi:CMP-N-acetylneuraminic acid synthetase
LEPSFKEEGEINYTKYKQLAEENKVFWILAAWLGYDVVEQMDIDRFLEAEQAYTILHSKQ